MTPTDTKALTPSSLADDEDARGFTPSDYAHTAELLRSSEAIRKAAASNNHNIILAALDRCADAQPPTEQGAEAAITEAIKRMDAIGRDWKADGQMQKFYATNYLVAAIRPLMAPPSPQTGGGK